EQLSDAALSVLFADERREQQAREKLLNEITSVIADSYSSIIYVDGEDMSVHSIRRPAKEEHGLESLHAGTSVRFMMDRYAEAFVFGDDRDAIAKFGDMDFVRMRLKRENPILRNYRALRDGKIVWHRLMIAPFDRHRKYVFAFENIDRQVQAERVAQAERERLSDMLEGLSREYLAVWFLDGKSGEVTLIENNCRNYDGSAEAIAIGRKKVDYRLSIGEYFKKFAPKEDYSRLMQETSYENLCEKVDEDATYAVNYRRARKNGSFAFFQVCFGKIIDASGNVNFVVGFRDIDAIMRDKLNREAEKETDRAVIKILAEEYLAVYLIDADTKTVIPYRENDLGRRIAAMAGMNYERVLTDCLAYLVRPEEADTLRKAYDFDAIMAVLQSGRTQSNIYRNREGRYRRVRFVKISEENGRIKRFAVSFMDVDESMKAERERQRELEAARDAAEAANRAKTLFLFNMSHDIRTPMNAIVGFADLAARRKDSEGKLDEYLHKIRMSSEHLLGILNDVLEMARIENNQVTIETVLTDARTFFSEMTQLAEEVIGAKALRFEFASNITHQWLYIDPVHTAEVLLNLVTNSVKYTPEGGAIRIFAREIALDGPDACIIETSVEDTGIGMSEEFLEHAFEAFSRERSSTVSSASGTGLGLAIVKRLVEQMEGSVRIESEQGRGTKVVFRIQHRIGAAPDVVVQAPLDESAVCFEGRRILLAEDKDLNAEIAIELLSEEGFQVDHAKDGDICVSMISQAPAGTWDAVLMDIQMPKLDGYEATRAIRALGDPAKSGIPILAMTANAFKEDVDKALAVGMNGHVAKPIHVKKLLQALSAILQ
nr:response regulator [Desulfovibrio sp.]